MAFKPSKMSESVLVTQGRIIKIESKNEESSCQDNQRAYEELEHNSDLIF